MDRRRPALPPTPGPPTNAWGRQNVAAGGGPFPHAGRGSGSLGRTRRRRRLWTTTAVALVAVCTARSVLLVDPGGGGSHNSNMNSNDDDDGGDGDDTSPSTVVRKEVEGPTSSAHFGRRSTTLRFFAAKHRESVRDMPPWLVGYIRWVAGQANGNATATKPRQQRFLVVECVRGAGEGQRCGGLADRLKFLPVALLLARNTGRILLLRWTRPHPLEEFLVPPGAYHHHGDHEDENFDGDDIKGGTTTTMEWRSRAYPEFQAWLRRHQSLRSKVRGTTLCPSRSGPGPNASSSSFSSPSSSFQDPFLLEDADMARDPSDRATVLCLAPPLPGTYPRLGAYFETRGGCVAPEGGDANATTTTNSNTTTTATTTTTTTAFTYSKVLRAAYHAMFRPSPALLSAIEGRLLPGEGGGTGEDGPFQDMEWGRYVAAHLRARHPALAGRYGYTSAGRRSVDADGMRLDGEGDNMGGGTDEATSATKRKVVSDAWHAVRCAAHLGGGTGGEEEGGGVTDGGVGRPPMAVYFASDTAAVVREVVEHPEDWPSQNGTSLFGDVAATVPPRVAGLLDDAEHLHLDRGEAAGEGVLPSLLRLWRPPPVEAYLPLFVDLLLLAGAACVSHGMGGYGALGGSLGSGGDCVGRHMRGRDSIVTSVCQRVDPAFNPFFRLSSRCGQPRR